MNNSSKILMILLTLFIIGIIVLLTAVTNENAPSYQKWIGLGLMAPLAFAALLSILNLVFFEPYQERMLQRRLDQRRNLQRTYIPPQIPSAPRLVRGHRRPNIEIPKPNYGD